MHRAAAAGQASARHGEERQGKAEASEYTGAASTCLCASALAEAVIVPILLIRSPQEVSDLSEAQSQKGQMEYLNKGGCFPVPMGALELAPSPNLLPHSPIRRTPAIWDGNTASAGVPAPSTFQSTLPSSVAQPSQGQILQSVAIYTCVCGALLL